MTHPVLYFSGVLCLFWGQSLPVAWEFWSSWFWLGTNPCPRLSPHRHVWETEKHPQMVSEKQPLHVCIGVYVHVYVRATMCVHVEPRVGHREPLSIALCGVALRQSSSMNRQLSILARQADWPESSHDSPISVIGC